MSAHNSQVSCLLTMLEENMVVIKQAKYECQLSLQCRRLQKGNKALHLSSRGDAIEAHSVHARLDVDLFSVVDSELARDDCQDEPDFVAQLHQLILSSLHRHLLLRI